MGDIQKSFLLLRLPNTVCVFIASVVGVLAGGWGGAGAGGRQADFSWHWQALYNFEMHSDEVSMQIARRYCRNCTFLDPIAVSLTYYSSDACFHRISWSMPASQQKMLMSIPGLCLGSCLETASRWRYVSKICELPYSSYLVFFFHGFQVPIIIHRRDLQRIAPLWLEKTIEIRRDRKNWPKYVPQNQICIKSFW